ncbi:diguanylate cyclase [Thalassotalea insulae]|uniref:Diguanylate cyclase n=1 Tax=Thalassotalea insulae TaxID=2056778 RepID=A0ABQ6GRM7_9GAMM|nr:EAL domain-containing protein [Thalassotalea insulae]GLX78608.1 diguanylate cyclase [Thalassotalea insulae]
MVRLLKQMILIVVVNSALLLISFNAQSANTFSQHLSVNDGLSQATVNDIYQDDQGYLWISTENGINLYDGYRFRVLSGFDDQFENSGFYKVIQDKQGLMWLIATQGLFTYDKNSDDFQLVLSHAPEKKEEFIVDVVEGQGQKMWIASAKYILAYDKKTAQLKTVVDLSDALVKTERIFEIFLREHFLFIATRAGVYVLNTTSGQWKKLPSINDSQLVKEDDLDKVYNLYVSPEKQLYLGTYSGVYAVNVANVASFLSDDASLERYRLIDKNTNSWAFKATEDALYVGSYSGLSKIDLTTDSAEQIIAYNDVYEDINNNVVTAIHQDKQGGFWLGSLVTGIYKWDPRLSLVTNLRYQKSNPNRLSNNVVWSIEQSRQDSDFIWIATEDGINQLSLSTGQVSRYLMNRQSKSVFSASYITQLKEDSQHRLWLLSAKGIKLFDTKTKQLIQPDFSTEVLDYLATDQYAIYLDTDDYLWSLTGKAFKRINVNTGEVDELKELEPYYDDSDIFNILGFLPNSKEMLLSTYNSLISFNVETRKTRLLYTNPEVIENDWAYIDSWVIDSQNVLWLAYSSVGLVGLDAESLQLKYSFNKKQSGIDNNIYGLALDADGDIWFSSHNGIYNLNRKTLHVRNFNIADGFSAREFNANAFEKINDHLFAYGSINGVSLFDPSALKATSFQGELSVHVTNIEVLSRDIRLPFILVENKPIELAYDDVGIRFDFSAFTYKHQDLQYNYRLHGSKNVNYPDTKDNFITFPSLPPGQHLLSVRVRSPYTGQYSPATELYINVSYAPWASPLAYLIYAVVALASFFLWLGRRRQYTRQLIDAHDQVKFREQRLSLALHGSNSDVWDWQAEGNLLFARRAFEELGFKNLSESYSFDQHIELIHENDREAFVHQWQTFLESGDLEDNFSCSYRLRTADGEWLWYKDLGKIVDVDNVGNPIRVTGSYTNITQSRAESERAQYYGEAFKQTKDWVLIISDNFTRVMVNRSLKEVFGWQEEELSFDDNIFGLEGKRRRFYKKLFQSLNEGDHWRGEELVKTKAGEEYHVLLNINVSMNQTTQSLHYVCIFTDITAQKIAEKELRYLANYDHLTDLPNRSLLLERIKHGMDYSKRIGRSIALFFIDLDRFKQVNDSLGHDHGDLLLQEITKRLKGILRVDDTVARLGGDEFVILLESFRNNSFLGQIAQKVIQVIGEPIDLNGNMVCVGASIGIALFPEDAADSDELLKNADVAMYHAKQLGRNTFQFFTPRMNVEANQRLHAESRVKQAHEQDEFINYYQPVVDSISGKAKGVELLLRWQKDELLISPGEFIAIAEEIGLIVAMTEKALARAFVDLKHWLTIREHFFISVNISAVHFTQDNFVDFLTEILARYEIPPHLLKLEVTESTLIKNPEQVVTKMTALAKLGVALALDDFGTGYSSLNYLKRLPLDVIKIDRSFVAGIGQDSADEAIVEATLVLANRLCMNCIAEGVETKEQLDYLAQRQCYNIQGYLYSKPVEQSVVTHFLQEDKVEISVGDIQHSNN